MSANLHDSRGVAKTQEAIKEVKDHISRIRSALKKVGCQDNIKVFRGADGLTDLFPGISDKVDIHTVVADYIKKGNKYVQFNGFTSCSVFKQTKFPKSVNLEIDVPKGTPGAYISSLSAKPNEYEFLLSDKVKYKIVGIRFDKETTEIILFSGVA